MFVPPNGIKIVEIFVGTEIILMISFVKKNPTNCPEIHLTFNLKMAIYHKNVSAAREATTI